MNSSLFIVSPITKQILPYYYSNQTLVQDIISDLESRGKPWNLIYYDGKKTIDLNSQADQRISSILTERKNQVLILAYLSKRRQLFPALKIPSGSILVLILTYSLNLLVPYYATREITVTEITDFIEREYESETKLVKYQGDEISELDRETVDDVLPFREEQILFIAYTIGGLLPYGKYQRNIPLLTGDNLTINEIMIQPESAIDQFLIEHGIDISKFFNENKLMKWKEVFNILRDNDKISKKDYVYVSEISSQLLFDISDQELISIAKNFNVPISDRMTMSKAIINRNLLGCVADIIKEKGYSISKQLLVDKVVLLLCDRDDRCKYVLKIVYPDEIKASIIASELGVGPTVYDSGSCQSSFWEIHSMGFTNLKQIPRISESKTYYYLISEFIEGGTLGWYLFVKEDVDYADLMIKIMDNVYTLAVDGHLKHDDLHINNIMVPESGKVYFIDFGITHPYLERGRGKITDYRLKSVKDVVRESIFYLRIFITDLTHKSKKSKKDKAIFTEKFINLIENLNRWLEDHYPKRYADFKYVVKINSKIEVISNYMLKRDGYGVEIPVDDIDINILKSWLDNRF